jgi:hypothetical protein
MVKQPVQFSPKFGVTSSYVFTQSQQNVPVEPGIHSLACWCKLFALPQLLYRWRHQSGIFWITPRTYLLSKIWYCTQILHIPEDHTHPIKSFMTWCILAGEIFRLLHRLESNLYLPPKEGVANVIDIQVKCHVLFLSRCLLEIEHTFAAAWSKLWNANFYMAKAVDMRTIPTQFPNLRLYFYMLQLQEDRSPTHHRKISQYVHTRTSTGSNTRRSQMRIILQRPSTVWPQVWRN